MKRVIHIPYADASKSFEIDAAHLLGTELPAIPTGVSIDEEMAALRQALDHPVGAGRLAELAHGARSAVVLVDDWTRPTPAYKIAPLVIDRLVDAGIPSGDIRILFARGTHQALNPDQMVAKLGAALVDRFTVENHDPDTNLTYLGESRRGTPVYINSTFLEADLRVAIGWLVAHPIAGYGGGAKIIVPGVAGRTTVNHNHALCEGTTVAIGIADGNPVREDMEDIARMAGLNVIVNVMLNAQREILDAVAGDFVAAHREGIRRNSRFFGFRVGEPADIVVLGASPRDATIYHGTFALPSAVPLTKPGGTIIWVAPCLTGAGTPEARRRFRDKLAVPSDELMAAIKRGEVPASGGVFDWCTSSVAQRNRVVLVSDRLNRREAEEFGFAYGESIQEALDEELSRNPEATVRVVPTGGLAVPIYPDEGVR